VFLFTGFCSLISLHFGVFEAGLCRVALGVPKCHTQPQKHVSLLVGLTILIIKRYDLLANPFNFCTPIV